MQEADYGVLFALLTANYGFTPDYIYNQLTWPQVRMYLQQVSQLEFRRHFPMAKLTAAVLNLGGGKPKASSKPDPGYEPWSPYELLVPYARLEDMVFTSNRITHSAAIEFLRLSNEGKLPSWVLATANIGQVWLMAEME